MRRSSVKRPRLKRLAVLGVMRSYEPVICCAWRIEYEDIYRGCREVL